MKKIFLMILFFMLSLNTVYSSDPCGINYKLKDGKIISLKSCGESYITGNIKNEKLICIQIAKMDSLIKVFDFMYKNLESNSNPINQLTTKIRNNLDTIECVIEEGKSSCKVKKNYNYIKELIKQKSTINEMKFLLPSQPRMIQQVVKKEYCQVWSGFKYE